MKLPSTFTEDKECVYAVIETPAGSRNKYDYDAESDYFQLNKVLPCGTSFPLDFGFIPHTKGGDGDPVDILVITDQSTFTGCVLECRILGVIEAEQREHNGKTTRNDRVIGVAAVSNQHDHLQNLRDLDERLINDVVHFFEYYNKMAGKKFRLLDTKGRKAALKMIRESMTR